MKVLILGARAPVALEWARIFKATGAEVWVADSVRWPLARFSNRVDGFVHIPAASTDLQGWLDSLRDLIVHHHIDLLLPTCEEVFYVSHVRAQLTALCTIPVMDFSTMHVLHHKGQFARFVQAFNIKAPETHEINQPEELAQWSANCDEWVFKAAYSRFAVQTLVAPQAKDLQQILPSEQQPWLVQRRVFGQEFCTYSIAYQGRLMAHACYTPRYRVGQGAGIYMQPVMHEEILHFVTDFVAQTAYTGQIGFDFIDDGQGHCYVLECNPRATSGLHLLTHEPQGLVNALLGRGEKMVLQPSDSRMVALAMCLFQAPKHGWKSEFWRDFSRAKDVIAHAGDYGPLLCQPLSLLELLIKSWLSQRDLLSASSDGLAWDGQALPEVV